MSKPETARMRELVDHWNITTVMVFLFIKMLQGIKRLFPPREDGWRRATRAYYRTEQSKFGFGLFGLRLLPQAAEAGDPNAELELIRRLQDLLKKYPLSYTIFHWSRLSVKIARKPTCDVVIARVSSDGSLADLTPCMEPELEELPQELIQEAVHIVCLSYNDTVSLPDKIRPWRLKKELMRNIRRSCGHPQTQKRIAAYADRLISAIYVCLEHMPEESALDLRFQEPEFARLKHPGFSPLLFVIRHDFVHNLADIWVSCSHIAADGTPVMEMLQDMKRQWGIAGPVLFPGRNFMTHPVLCSSAADGIYHVALFLDFTSFFAERKRLMQTYGVDVQVLALLAWGLSRHTVFSSIKMVLPAELSETAKRERTLGLIYMRPAKYYDSNSPEMGFLKYRDAYANQVLSTKRGTSTGYELTESFALLPPVSYSMTLKALPRTMAEYTGTMVLSVVKDAEFIIGALSDANVDGFVALGCMKSPSWDGGTVGAVSIKGTKKQVYMYAQALKEVFADFHI